MAQISTSTSDAQNFDPVAARASLNAIRARLLGSKTIRAQDIRDIVNIYNAWLQHTHSVYDNYYVAFGNKAPYGTQGANIATGVPVLPTQITNGLLAAWGTPGVYQYTIPANVTKGTIELAGGGGGGGGSSTHTNQDAGPGAGGGSGNYRKVTDIALTPGSVLQITIGAGGIGGNYGIWAPGANGANGGTTAIDLISGGNTTRLWTSAGGYGGQGCVGWPGSNIWGSSGRPAAKGGYGGGTTISTSGFLYVGPGLGGDTYWAEVFNDGYYNRTDIVWKYGSAEAKTATFTNGPLNSYNEFTKGAFQNSTEMYYSGENYGMLELTNLYRISGPLISPPPSGSSGYSGNDGGAGNSKWATSYQCGNGGGVGGPGIANVSGGDGVNGFLGAIQSANRWKNTWYQNQGAGGGGCAGNGVGMNGGLGGGGGGGSLSEIKGGDGGNGYVGIYVPGAGAVSTSLPNVAVGNNIILDDIRNLMALINAIRTHLHQTNDGYL